MLQYSGKEIEREVSSSEPLEERHILMSHCGGCLRVATASCHPQFVVTYRDMKGIEPYWSYSGQSAGLAGAGYVNNATGSMILSKAILSTTDSLMPYAPTVVYNSALSATEYKYPNAQISYWGTYMPCGFKLSIQEMLIKKKYISAEGTDVYYFV